LWTDATHNKEDKLGFAFIWLTIVGSLKLHQSRVLFHYLLQCQQVTLAPPFETPPFTTTSDPTVYKTLKFTPEVEVGLLLKSQMF
jgi:hypothetical protein